jgi:hypothetical protein
MWHSKYQGLTRLMVSKLSGVSISQIICIYASGHALFLSRKASQFTHEYFMYAKVKNAIAIISICVCHPCTESA